MPLARIITRAVEDSLELTMQLRARGYQVETVAPDQVPPTPADLEVHLEECDSEQAVSRAALTNPNDNLWVFVAPGALDERARPMRVISLVPQNERRASQPIARIAPAVVLPFPPAEDDPILSELESDVILAETEARASVGPARDAASEPVSVEQAMVSPSATLAAPAAPTTSVAQELAPGPKKRLPEQKDEFQIPRVPERRIATSISLGVSKPPRKKRAVFKVDFRLGPSFWRTAWTSMALVVLAGALGVIVGMRLPAPGTAPQPITTGSAPPAKSQPAPRSTNPPVKSQTQVPVATRPPASAPRQASQRAAASGKPKRAPRAASSHADDIIAEDTVVFYDRAHGTHASKVSPQVQVRKYSDQN